MVSSWFQRDTKPPLKEIIATLYTRTPLLANDQKSRFSPLLLEHGEKHLQDWAVLAQSSPIYTTTSSPRKSDTIQWAQVNKASPRRSSKTPIVVEKESHPSVYMSRVEGRLHLCSRSIVFEPNDPSKAIIRCPFTKMDGTIREYPSENSFENMSVECSVKRHTIMKVNNVIGPFEAIHNPTRFQFTFLHSSPKPFVELSRKLVQLVAEGKLRPHHATPPELDVLLKPMDRPFHTDNLIDIREQILFTTRCALVSPLQERPGMIAVTHDRIYFQPAAGVLTATETRALRWSTRSLVATARRYRGLKDSGLELYFADGSFLLALDRRHDRETFLRYLPDKPCVTDRDFVVQANQEWQSGSITNFEYLLALNSAAGRSFHDLSRYPVFPWVIADYESSKLDLNKEKTYRDLTKPVGALNPDRLKYFETRLEGMKDMEDAFLYGTHYSAPGYVLYYLVRSMPEHMLCLQNGKFDAPDRMFHSIKHCFSCALTNHADVKELIPEFYNPNNDFDFLINARGLQLGATQNGDRVDDVMLPPWARSPRDFIKKNRKALESDICTRMLPKWIDLIFGDKSRGEAAMEASNLFHRITYLGPTDLASMQSEEERFQAELQATEFGIVPDQLFKGPHPMRFDNVGDDFIGDIGRASSKDNESGRETWELLDPPSHSHSSVVESAVEQPEMNVLEQQQPPKPPHVEEPSWTSNQMVEQSREDHISLPLRGTGEPTTSRSVGFSASEDSQSPKSSLSPKMIQSFDSSSPSDWDLKFLERIEIHGDAVSGSVLLLSPEESLLATTSLDGGLKVHKVSLGAGAEEADRKGFPSTFGRFSYSTIISRGQIGPATSQASKLSDYRSHSSRDPLACLVLAGDGDKGHVAFAGGHDDVVLAYGVNSACAVASVYSHRDAVTGLDLIERTPFDADNSLWLEKSTHIMISGSWDATVKVWSASVSPGEAVAVNREPLAELFDADSSIVCLSAKKIASTGCIVIAAGCADGSFCVWNVHADGVQVVIHKEPARRGSGPCSVVKWVAEAGKLTLFAAFSTGMVASYVLGNDLQRQNAVSVGTAVLSLVYIDGLLLLGCGDGALRLIPVVNGKFEKPTLWHDVNNKSAPGISSLSTATIDGKCICCSGGQDGSIALFELKKN